MGEMTFSNGIALLRVLFDDEALRILQTPKNFITFANVVVVYRTIHGRGGVVK